jgi:hypothetical protein
MAKTRNELISFSAVFMNYWAGLHNSSDAENIKDGADSLLRLAAAAALLRRQKGDLVGEVFVLLTRRWQILMGRTWRLMMLILNLLLLMLLLHIFLPAFEIDFIAVSFVMLALAMPIDVLA